MFLKRIALHGFKSFADRTEFEFGHGVTVVVGPNGCGKSNVVDAIKWVLGEQSARSLRGTKMSDVIFSGSRSRKPANLAEVQLTFDNHDRVLSSEQDEVIVTRQLFRSGASEYLLNGHSCRLRDIRDLFLDTGVGVDAYSVIEQGRVDVLLQANPVERREIFEEAAGISKYKVRRTEAQRKLERSRQNLLRLNDVIDEVEKQLRSVRLAAGKARNYLTYDARLRELRSAFSLAEYRRLDTSRTDLNGRCTHFVDALQSRRAELAARDAQGAELEQSLSRLDDQLSAGEAQLLALQTDLSTLAERISQGRRRREEYTAAGQRQNARVAELSTQAADAASRIDGEKIAAEELDHAVARQSAEIDALREQHQAASQRCDQARKALEQARSAAFDSARREALLNNERQNIEQYHRRLDAQLAALRARQTALNDESRQIAERREAQKIQLADLDHESARQRESLREIEDGLAALDLERQRLEREIVSIREARSAVMSRLAVLEDMERRLDGVNEAVRAVLSWRESAEGGSSPGILGLVADVMRVDNPDVVLLDSVLAAFENHVVVENTYEFLSELNRREPLPGAVGVLALDRVVAARAVNTYRDNPGFLACARDWVVCESRYEPLADHLFGRIIIVDSVERALAMASNAAEGFIFVTREGHTLSSDGRLTVGAKRGVHGLISRKTEIRQLRNELDEIETRLESTDRERIAVAAKCSDADLARRASLEGIAKTGRLHSEAQSILARLGDDAARIDQSLSLIRGELSSAEQALRETEQNAVRLASEAESVARSHTDLELRVTQLDTELATVEVDARSRNEDLTAARVELGRCTEKRTAAQNALARLVAQLQAIHAEQAQAQREVESLAGRIAQLESELTDSQSRHTELGEDCEQRRSDLTRLREERQSLRGQIDHCSAEARAIHAAIEKLDAELNEVRVAQREIEVRVETLVQRVRDELALDLAELFKSYEHTDQDWDAIREEIESLRQKIERLGNVNLDSIAELEQLTPRHENLIVQRDDLLNSIGRLETLIEELNRESRERFIATLEAIREHFRELFRKLFGGGKADIILENPEDPLECGIEIIARPPGKEPQSISLLSGGEKTMAAVALLLAVFKSRPSPFAILDEVDAALDESNNERFNSVIQDFLAHSQFIIVTHSKVTMHGADALYGVTMEEAGVSKRVSVRFDDRVQAPVGA